MTFPAVAEFKSPLLDCLRNGPLHKDSVHEALADYFRLSLSGGSATSI